MANALSSLHKGSGCSPGGSRDGVEKCSDGWKRKEMEWSGPAKCRRETVICLLSLHSHPPQLFGGSCVRVSLLAYCRQVSFAISQHSGSAVAVNSQVHTQLSATLTPQFQSAARLYRPTNANANQCCHFGYFMAK